jgi:NADP-dependent 3-hydroxy acid dehydrogenase YdfG
VTTSEGAVVRDEPGIGGKVVVLVGASSGIGEATARRLAAGGAKLVLAARRRDRLDSLVADLLEEGWIATAVEVDVRSRDDVRAAVETAVTTHGRLDVMVNNAGVMPISRLDRLEVDHWESMIDVNLRGVLWGIAAALPVMRAQGSGHIVNTASVGAQQVAPGGAVYSATKAAVRTLSEGLRLEEPDLQVTVVSPGAAVTELGHDITDEAMVAAGSGVQVRAMSADAVAEAIAYAVAQPGHVDVSEIVVRPTGGF